ncbi:nucleotide sugar dehydrogenase [Romboutsia sp.]|uniref:nucleotide sugar dehydrogenase n=1 Tax=Romboutsia sp. TaxID=1965302 RepID=UPI003F32FE6E
MNKKICIVGLGYIGLPTAAMLASCGHNVIGVDTNKKVVENLKMGKILIKEPHLDKLVKEVVKNKNLIAINVPCEADVFIIAVPTPINEEKKANLDYVLNAMNSILPYLKKGNVVILESTSPVGTTKDILKPILESTNLKVGEDLYLAYCPERVLPGNILTELANNHRVIGGINEASALIVKQIYECFVRGDIYITDTKTAEMVKLVENTYRDVNIALSNELLKICDSMSINIWNVIKYSNKHPRVNLLDPGPGVGGHCLAVDPWFIVENSPNLSNIIKLSRLTNDSMPRYIFNNIDCLIKHTRGNKKVSILGMTYKADIDDIRQSPIVDLIDILQENNYEVSIYDPYVKEHALIEDDLFKCVKNSSILVIGVNHSVFKYIDFKEIIEVMSGNLILDTRNFLDKDKLEKIGFKYKLVGA